MTPCHIDARSFLKYQNPSTKFSQEVSIFQVNPNEFLLYMNFISFSTLFTFFALPYVLHARLSYTFAPALSYLHMFSSFDYKL